MSTGWIKLHRKIFDHEIWNDVTTFRLFTLLLLKASHQDGIKINGIELKKGQYIRSYSKLCEDLCYKERRALKKVSKSTILRSIKKLVENGMVTVCETDIGTLFTIVKYESYQGLDGQNNSNYRTANEPSTERLQNDCGTIAEPKQEFKNLRIKEFKEEEEERSPVGNDSPFQQIEDKYLSRRGGGLMITPNDAQAIERIIQEHIPLEDILVWIDEIFDQYRPRHRADGIKSFSYLEKGILDRWHAKNNQPSNVSEFKPKKQQDNLSALEAYAKEKGIKFGGGLA
ncbi:MULTISPECIES: hypothetical protein [Bacillus]|uniref:hypothetical protein n=1 Tax=Bacillus TaxID=1386 RepID=UPI00240A366E|nr:hypothetical protein [Bacillus altitudinis]WEZ69642.1 hypothetical protein P5623_00125 [Bacillus altitudinis]